MISALGSILSPLVMSTVFAIIRGSGGDQWLALFPYYLVGVIMGYFCIMHVKKGDVVPLTPEELDELRAIYLAD